MAENDDALIWLAGGDPQDIRPLPPFSPQALDFLAALSAALRADPAAKGLGDVQAFAFWCRRSHLEQLCRRHQDGRLRLGRGLLFHVAPANVAVNFAFSFAFGLLAGCANVVRVPSRRHETVTVIANAIAGLLAKTEFSDQAKRQGLVRYNAASAWSAYFSARADGRLIWGGDATIAALRALPVPPRCVDVAFSDRTSVCVIDADKVAGLDQSGLERLAEGFYNDTYVMDQNACSSPHLVVWLGQGQEGTGRFWSALADRVRARYVLAPVQAVDKYTDLLNAVLDGQAISGVLRLGGGLSVATLKAWPADLENMRGRFGLFRQIHVETLEPLAAHLTGRFQTLSYFGLEPKVLGDFITRHRLAGIDRVVPVGQGLDMDVVWDGFDLIGQLSRIIDLR